VGGLVRPNLENSHFFDLTFPLQDALTITVERDEKYPTFVNHVFKTDEFSFKTAHYHGDEVRTIQKKNYNLHHVFFR